MSQTQFVEYRDQGFWAYDVVLRIFLKHLIDAAEARISSGSDAWLASAVQWWRVVAGVGDYGLKIDPTWSSAQIDVFAELADEVCNALAGRASIPADEISGWEILDNLRIYCRGASEVATKDVTELARAIIALVKDSLAAPPPGTVWLYGAPGGPKTIGARRHIRVSSKYNPTGGEHRKP